VSPATPPRVLKGRTSGSLRRQWCTLAVTRWWCTLAVTRRCSLAVTRRCSLADHPWCTFGHPLTTCAGFASVAVLALWGETLACVIAGWLGARLGYALGARIARSEHWQ
jgi:hypothetical protein